MASKYQKRHYEDVCEKAVKAGVARHGYLVPLGYDSRPILESVAEATIPVGASVPSITSATEICMDCGCVYAPMVIISKAKKIVAPTKLWKPGDNR